MRDKELLKIKRYIELEEYLLENADKTIETDQFMVMIFVDFNNIIDLEYLSLALKIPFDALKEALDYYDSFEFYNKPNELEFVDELTKKFNVEEGELFKRIRQVRKIDYVKNGKKKKRCRIKSAILELLIGNKNNDK